MVLLDTCALIWWTADPGKLSSPAAIACNDIPLSGGLISSISIWEIGIKIKKGTLDLGLNLEDFVSRLRQISNFSIIPVDELIWLKNLSFDWTHRDPADRTIVATAALYQVPIVTKDEVIRDFFPNVIW